MNLSNELRIGNLVSAPEENECNYPPPRAYETITVKWIGEATVNNFSCSIIEPIPLTPEWLERFGFEELTSKGMKGMFALIMPQQIMLTDLDMWEFGIKLNGEPFQMPCPQLKHVHQLQNLYFALTGEELILKEK